MKTSIVLCRLVERLVEEPGMDEFGAALSEAAIEFGFDSFVYLILPRDPHGPPEPPILRGGRPITCGAVTSRSTLS
jgi:hypothetical protein